MADDEPRFEWDEAKAGRNWRKHGVDFGTATRVFGDPFAIEKIDHRGNDDGEHRYLITGMSGDALLTVVYTDRGVNIRIISARGASKYEHDDYHIENSPI